MKSASFMFFFAAVSHSPTVMDGIWVKVNGYISPLFYMKNWKRLITEKKFVKASLRLVNSSKKGIHSTGKNSQGNFLQPT